MTTLVLIPARGGSKRVPGKNLRCVGGVPLVVRAIRCAHEAGFAPTVSTDDMQIAEVSAAAGADILLRHARLATDTTQLEPVIEDAVRRTAPRPKRVVVLQPTSPLRKAAHVTDALALLDAGYDSVVAVVREPHLAFSGRMRPDHWTPGGRICPLHAFVWLPFSPTNRPRTQDEARAARPLGYDCGLLYATTVASLRRTLRRDGGQCAALVVDRWDAIDVDSEEDLEVADALLARRVVVR